MPDIWASFTYPSTFFDFGTISSSTNAFMTGHVFNLFMSGRVQTQGIVYTGILTSLIAGFIGAAWVIYKTVVASINWSSTVNSYASNYRVTGGDIYWGNNLALYEIIAVLMHEGWAFVLCMWSLWFAFDLWAQVEKREKGYKEEGSGGEVVDIVEAMKMFTLCLVVALTTFVGAFSLGDLTEYLITWYDNYTDDVKQAEANNLCEGQDADGTAAKYDMIYHYVTLLYGYILFSVIAFGGVEFGFYFLKWNDDFECDFDVADSGAKDDVRDLINSIKTVEQCYTILPQVNKKMDFNGDGKISRCDSAILLKHFGNTEEYAKKYAFRAAWDTTTECNNFFDPLYY